MASMFKGGVHIKQCRFVGMAHTINDPSAKPMDWILWVIKDEEDKNKTIYPIHQRGVSIPNITAV